VQFDDYADTYDCAIAQGLAVSGENKMYFAQGRIERLAQCLENLGDRPRRILDFGCGIAANAPLFQRHWPDVRLVLGVDVSAKCVELSQRDFASARVRFCVKDAYRPDESFDLVYCNGVFHHIPVAERHCALDYVRQSLRPGGLFALWENNPCNPGTRYVMSRIPFDRDAVPLRAARACDLLRSGGFHILHMEYAFIFPHLLRWLRPLERRLSKLPIGGQYLVLCRK
jgi:SAM-dependent methyltransferase